ncbi:MAG: dihydroorotase [bacterium]|jgi:dihydroorotase|nr:dihydroorotase [bacterium]
MKTLIQNARVLDPASRTDQVMNVLLDGDRIAAFAPGLSDPEAVCVDATGLWLFPGLIDIHVHLREPGFEGKETIYTGTRAAAAGGVTAVCCMANTNPPIDNKTGVEFIQERVAKTGCVRVYPIGTVTKGMEGKELAPLGEMIEAGAVGFSDDGRGVMDTQVMRRILEYSTIFGTPIISHEEDHSMTENCHMNEGQMSVKLGMIGMPREAETIIIARDLILAGKTGAHIHFAHVSTKESVDLIRFYKNKGVKATAETAPHYLLLTEEAVEGFNTNAKMNPPLRTREDQDALVEGILDGTIDCIATDHAPHSVYDKDQEFPLAPFGIVGLETLLPLLLNQIQEKLKLDVLSLLSLVTNKPARVMRLPGGVLAPGAPADLVVWNPDPKWTIEKSRFYSKSRNTPFDGWPVQGKVHATYVAGKPVYPFT